VGDCAGLSVGCVEAGPAGCGRGSLPVRVSPVRLPSPCEKARYFPGIPEGFPNAGDLRVVRALVKMSIMLHSSVLPSSRCDGHEKRTNAHRRRIRKKMRRVRSSEF
jgi:hypothetical protein